MKVFYFFVLLLLATPMLAQKQANEWYFGAGAGISFKNGAPIPIYDGKLVSMEGCGSVCDKNGILLFYSDGQNVWNAQHSKMPNGTGLIGGEIGTTSGSSAAQGVLIVADPTNPSRYYIFIAPDVNFGRGQKTNRLSAYIVDMTLDKGLGDVLPGLIQLNPSSEKLTGTVDCFGTGYWIVSHDDRKNEFYSYHLSKSGLNKTPVVSTVGKLRFFDDYSVSCMKISPNGKMLALPVRGNKDVEFFNFNNATGLVSTPRTILNNVFAYGVSFSPNSEKLYINARKEMASEIPTPLLQFTVREDATEKEIIDSKKIIAPSVSIGAMQIGPDKNIYLVQYGQNFVSAIINPDDSSAQYIQRAVVFKRDSPARTEFGLPNFIDNIFHTGDSLAQCFVSNITGDTICENGFASFKDIS